ncbi:MAG: hypothetical protein IKJ04_01615, partial [Clostridia bacterium]|nr:hypothetical protein [Clostridia bacterium]
MISDFEREKFRAICRDILTVRTAAEGGGIGTLNEKRMHIALKRFVCSDESKYEADMEVAQEINYDILRAVYHGAYVMYYEQTLEDSESAIEPYQVFIKEEALEDEQRTYLEEYFSADIYGSMVSSFEQYRYQIDYYATNGMMTESNASANLGLVLAENGSVRGVEELILYYRNLWVMSFDENGQMQVKVLTSEDVSADMLIKGIKKIENDHKISNRLTSYIDITPENAAGAVKKIEDFAEVYGISEESTLDLMRTEEWYGNNGALFYHIRETAGPAFFITVLFVAVFAIAMYSPKIWKSMNIEENVSYPVFELGLM